MPYQIIKKKNGRYKVINSETGRVHAADTSKKKAEAQIRVMQMAENNSGALMGKGK